MDLNLDIAAMTRPGRKPAPLHAHVVRELESADLAALAAPRNTEPAELKRLSERHHALARSLASGMSEAEAAALTGYDLSRVSNLKRSPAFQELLALYRDRRDAEFAEMHAMLAGLSKDAALELRTRLEDSPGEITLPQLLDILKMGADRTGFGPTSKQETTVRVDLSTRLEAARTRARIAQGDIIDVTPEAD